MQENINIPDSTITTNLSFRNLVLMNMQQLTNFPYIEKDFDALTDYELLCLVVKYLNDVIANQNEQNNSITRMYESFLALQDYVNNTKDELEDAFNNLDDYVRNYFDNLDVQEEINNKLDQMLEDGVLEQIIEQFLQSTAVWCFNTVADMKQATNLTNGSYAKTLGYYEVNDGGSGLYKITNTQSQTDYQETLNSGLYATLIINDYINVKQFGAKGDGINDDTQSIQNAINLIYNNISSNLKNNAFKTRNVVLIPEGIYLTKSTIDLPVVVRILTNGNPKILVDFDEGSGIYLNSRNLSHISYEDGNDFQNYISGNIIDSTSGSLTIEKKDSFYYGDTTTTGSVGLEVGDRTFTTSDISSISRCNFNNINISGFETGLALNYSNLYIVTFNNFVIQENYYNIYTSYHESTGNAGEKITFKDCLFGIARYGIYIRWGLAGSLNFDNCSFDYMGCVIKSMFTVTGSINIYGGHIEGIGYENPNNNMRTRFPGEAKDWGFICYYNTSNASYKLMLNITDTVFSLVNCGSSDNGKRFGSALVYNNLSSFDASVSTQQNLIVNLTDVNFNGTLGSFNDNTYDTNQIFLAESGVNISFKHSNTARGFRTNFGAYYNDFVGRFVATDPITNYYAHRAAIHSALSFTLYDSSTKGTYDSDPYFAKALSVTSNEAVNNMGISRITYPASKHIRICFIYKLNNLSISTFNEQIQIWLYGKNYNNVDMGNTQNILSTQFIMKEPNNGWNIVIAETSLNELPSIIWVTPRVFLQNPSDGTNQNFTGTMDIGGLLIDYCD